MSAEHRRAGLAAALDAIDVSSKDFQELLFERRTLSAEDIDRAKLALRALDEARTRIELSMAANDAFGRPPRRR